MKQICMAIIGVTFLSVVSAFGADELVLKARVKLFKRPDTASPCYRYLEEGEKVYILMKSADGWLKVGTDHKLESGKRMVGYINPDLPVVQKASTGATDVKPAPTAEKAPGAPVPISEITLISAVPTCESQIKAQVEKHSSERAALVKELDVQKKALLDAAATGSAKDKTIESLRAQAADNATKLAGIQNSVDFEAFRLLSEKASVVRLRGFGSVRLVPLLDDYLVIIPPDLGNQVKTFFAKIRKSVLVGKAGTYLICDRKYFVPAAPAAVPPPATGHVHDTGVQP